jgi:hypothetical protein
LYIVKPILFVVSRGEPKHYIGVKDNHTTTQVTFFFLTDYTSDLNIIFSCKILKINVSSHLFDFQHSKFNLM